MDFKTGLRMKMTGAMETSFKQALKKRPSLRTAEVITATLTELACAANANPNC